MQKSFFKSNNSSWKIFLFIAFVIVTQLTIVVLFFTDRPAAVFTRPTGEGCGSGGGSEAYGDILFSGDTFGRTSESGCSRLGSLAGRASIVRKFPVGHRVYLDFGNQLSDEPVKNRAEVPYLSAAYRRMGLGALNLTRRDLLKLLDCGSEFCGIPLVSANLRFRIRNSPLPASGETMPFHIPRIVSHVVLPLRLCGGDSPGDVVSLAVTGISDDLHFLHRGRAVVTSADIASSLKKIMPLLEKADLKVLLFNESFFKLEVLLSQPGIGFDLVLAASSLPGHVNRAIVVKGTPVVFSEEEGRSLGHVRVFRKAGGSGFRFEYRFFAPGLGAPKDGPTLELVKMISRRIHKSRSDGLSHE